MAQETEDLHTASQPTRTIHESETTVNTPRWETSQKAIESALLRGPRSIKELCDQTGYSHTTVKKALARAQASPDVIGWPRRYSLVKSNYADLPAPRREPEIKYLQLVEPLTIPMEDLGPLWQSKAKKIGEEIGEIDLETLSLKQAIKNLELEAASLLGAIIVLRAVKDGPDWREQIGLKA